MAWTGSTKSATGCVAIIVVEAMAALGGPAGGIAALTSLTPPSRMVTDCMSMISTATIGVAMMCVAAAVMRHQVDFAWA